jgi:two-component system, NtrC family, response regulator GlrR
MKEGRSAATTSLGYGIGIERKQILGANPQASATQPSNARILVVDNDSSLSRQMMTRLRMAGYKVSSASSGGAAIDLCARFRPNLVITDLRIEDMDGLGLLKVLKSRWVDLSVIILTAYASIAEAVRATQYGAFGFLIKPIEKSELLGQVQRAIAASDFTQVKAGWRENIVSRSQLMEDRLGQANRVARSDSPLILSGESGTGKELFARAIHAASARCEKPFIAVECRARDEIVLEGEIFGEPTVGYAVDASACKGALLSAAGGTLLLSEVGQLPLRLQRRLAESLHDAYQPFRADGEVRNVSARLICTTTVDLKRMVDIGSFHEDLYYKLNILTIEVPPLGRRREDIPLLVASFLAQAKGGVDSTKAYTPKAVRLLVSTDWPGNVRQLLEVVKSNVSHFDGQFMTEEFVQQSLGGDPKLLPSYDEARDEFSRDYLVDSLTRTRGNVSKSARIAKRNRTDFYKLLLRFRISPTQFKKGAREKAKW